MDLKNQIKLSIIVPVYNVEKYIVRCMDSILNQNLTDYEIIVINDGTQDSSMDYVREKSRHHRNIIILEQENKGLSAARNAGIECARGEYLMFCDSDDEIMPNCLRGLYKEAKSSRLDMLLYDADTIYDESNVIGRGNGYKRVKVSDNIMQGGEMLKELLDNNEYCTSACLYLIRREFINQKKLRFQEGIIHEDELFTPMVLTYAVRTAHRKYPIYVRHLRNQSITTGTKENEKLKNLGIVISELNMFAKKDSISNKNRKVLKQLIILRVQDFLGRCAWMNDLDTDVLVKRYEIIEIVKKDRLWLGLRFYLYLLSIKPRKFMNKRMGYKWGN